MKTEKQLRRAIEVLIKEADENKKKRPNVNQYLEAIKIVNTLTQIEIVNQRNKLIDELKKIEELFDKYLQNFTLFKRRCEKQQRKEVRSIFNKEFEVSKCKSRIKRLNFILNE